MRLTYGVVTATLNARASLARALSSVLTQSRTPDEIVVIDGGSTDGTFDLAMDILAAVHTGGLASRDVGASRAIRQQGTGLANAWNEGIDALSSDIVFLVNADDTLEPGTAEAVMQIFESSPEVDIVHGNARFTRGDGTHIGIVAPCILSRLGVRCRTLHCATMVRRDVYTRLGGFDGAYRVALDFDFLERCYRAGASFRHINRTLSTFALGGVSSRHSYLADLEVLQIGLQHSRSKVLPIAAFLARSMVLRPLRLAGYQFASPETEMPQ